MLRIPSLLLRQLYTYNSLRNEGRGVRFSVKNRLKDARIERFRHLKIDGQEVPADRIRLELEGGDYFAPDRITASSPIEFPLRQVIHFEVQREPLEEGKHKIEVAVDASPFGKLVIKVEDGLAQRRKGVVKVPRSEEDDYSASVVRRRRDFVREYTGVDLKHVSSPSFDPELARGNIENFTGVAQVPLGFAGPLKIDGEHASGEFLIPLATSEGTLVASYNRGMKALNLSGGVKCTVVGDAMQRAPVFVFDDARGAREFVKWIDRNLEQIQREAESTTRVGKLNEIDCYQANKFAFLRFNFFTGDAAGQNMVGRATFAACSWILDQFEGVRHFYLESNFATDKKASQVNIMRTRGKRVTAEAVIKRDVLMQRLRVEPENLVYHAGVANVGALLSGANNNGLHSANAITAMFIATGQDVANVAESSAGVVYSELTPERDLYVSITIPSLIVATYGGGTGLPTQRECLEVLGCFGKGKVNKFAEIVAGAVLAGEISLAAAISASDWVSSHEEYGRNR